MRNALPVAVVCFVLSVAPHIAAAQTAPAASTTIAAPARQAPAPKKEPMDALTQAIKAYQDGRYKEALKLADEAESGIRIKHAEIYRTLLPPAPNGGWKIEEKAESDEALHAQAAAGLSMLSRSYTANGHKVTISFLTDSPMLAMLSSLMQVANANDKTGKALLDVKGNKALYRETAAGKKSSHQLMVYAGDVIVTVQSETLPKGTLLQFANIVDYEKLKAVP